VGNELTTETTTETTTRTGKTGKTAKTAKNAKNNGQDALVKAHTSWRHIWSISWPIFLANITVPLVSAVDTAMMGRMPDPAYIGGVALGALVFNFIYYGFGFLRLCSTGLVAQAHGRKDETEIENIFIRGIFMAMIMGLVAIAAVPLTLALSNFALAASPKVESLMNVYVGVRMYALPAGLANMVLLGCLFGRQQMRLGMAQLLIVNIGNLVLNIYFVMGLGMKIEGVALASVAAQWIGFVVTLGMVWWQWRVAFRGILGRIFRRRPAWFNLIAFTQFFKLGRDLLIRTLLLLGCEALLLNKAAIHGDLNLAAVQLAMVVFGLICFGIDGFAHAAEALVGEAVGMRNKAMFNLVVYRSNIMAFASSLAIGAVIWLFSEPIVATLTTQQPLAELILSHWIWVALMAPAMVLAMQMDGVFVGATKGREMRNGMIVASLIFATVIWFIAPFGVAGLLAAFNIYLLVRGFALWAQIGRIRQMIIA